MEEQKFKEFLENKYTPKSVASRMSRARKAEEILGYSLDDAVSSETKMFEALNTIKPFDNREENYQNVIRCYYELKNGKSFPKLKEL